jgi:hypothetical protein
MRRSALACISTSVVAAAVALAGDAPLDPARVGTAELEAQLAKKPNVYLVLDPPRRVIEVKARGVVLDSIAVSGIEIVSHQPLLRRSAPEGPALPALWSVEDGPGDTDREVIAPAALRPYTSEEEEEEEPAATPTPAGTRGPAPKPTQVPEPPSSYRSRLSSGWDLWVTDALPPSGIWDRYWAAVREGWARLRGDARQYRPAITVALARPDAQRLHHLMRKGMAVIIAAGSP